MKRRLQASRRYSRCGVQHSECTALHEASTAVLGVVQRLRDQLQHSIVQGRALFRWLLSLLRQAEMQEEQGDTAEVSADRSFLYLPVHIVELAQAAIGAGDPTCVQDVLRDTTVRPPAVAEEDEAIGLGSDFGSANNPLGLFMPPSAASAVVQQPEPHPDAASLRGSFASLPFAAAISTALMPEPLDASELPSLTTTVTQLSESARALQTAFTERISSDTRPCARVNLPSCHGDMISVAAPAPLDAASGDHFMGIAPLPTHGPANAPRVAVWRHGVTMDTACRAVACGTEGCIVNIPIPEGLSEASTEGVTWTWRDLKLVHKVCGYVADGWIMRHI